MEVKKAQPKEVMHSQTSGTKGHLKTNNNRGMRKLSSEYNSDVKSYNRYIYFKSTIDNS